MTSSGIDAQIGFVAESSFGTFAVPTKFAEFTSESLKFERERINSKGIKAGRRTLNRWAQGVQRVNGDIELEMGPVGTGTLLKHAFGGSQTTGAGPYVHTLTPGSLDDKSLTIQVGRPDIGGVVRAFSYLGCSITGFELSCKVNEYLMGKFSIYGTDEVTSESLATASYPAGWSPFVFTEGVLSIAGSSYDVTQLSLGAKNGQKVDRHFIRASGHKPKIALESEQREYSGTLTSDFIDLTAYNRFKNGTEAALVLTFTSGANILEITTNVRFDGETPNIGGIEIPEQSLPFVCVSSTSDAAAITAVLTTTDATI